MIIDEMSRAEEAKAARSCKSRGVRMIASAHGDFKGLVDNADLRDLVGAPLSVIFGDKEAAQRGGSKIGTERVNVPSFDIVIEVERAAYDTLRIISNVPVAVDAVLQKKCVQAEERVRIPNSKYFLWRRVEL